MIDPNIKNLLLVDVSVYQNDMIFIYLEYSVVNMIIMDLDIVHC